MTTETEGYAEWLVHLTDEVKKAIHGMSAVNILEDTSYRPIFVPAANVARFPTPYTWTR